MSADSLAAELHERGLRLTPQRQLILDAVSELGHSTPEEIADYVQVRAPGVNITTVYRALDLLESLGLVRHAHIGHGPATYHRGDDLHHIHTLCHSCGRVTSLPSEILDGVAAELLEAQGFVLDAPHVALSGLCRDCHAAATESDKPGTDPGSSPGSTPGTEPKEPAK